MRNATALNPARARKLSATVGEICDAVNALPAAFDSLDAQASAVLAIFDGRGSAAFWIFDNTCYSCTRDRFGLVRAIRNHPIHGLALFEALNRKPATARR